MRCGETRAVWPPTIFNASEACHAAMSAATGPSTPTVSQVTGGALASRDVGQQAMQAGGHPGDDGGGAAVRRQARAVHERHAGLTQASLTSARVWKLSRPSTTTVAPAVIRSTVAGVDVVDDSARTGSWS